MNINNLFLKVLLTIRDGLTLLKLKNHPNNL